MEASNHASNQDPLKSRAAKKPTVSKGPYFSKSKATKASGNKVTKASQVRGKPAGKDAEVPRSSKKAQPKKNVRDTQLQDSEEDDFEGDEPVKIPRKTKKAKESSGRKPPWRDPIEEQRVIELVKEIQSDPAIDKKISFSEDKWKLIRQLLEQRYGFIRTLNGIKNHWTRKLRAQSGYDERGEGHKNPTKMRTSVESPEERVCTLRIPLLPQLHGYCTQEYCSCVKLVDVMSSLVFQVERRTIFADWAIFTETKATGKSASQGPIIYCSEKSARAEAKRCTRRTHLC